MNFYMSWIAVKHFFVILLLIATEELSGVIRDHVCNSLVPDNNNLQLLKLLF